MRILSGVQPSGTLHLGNYYGAVQQHIELQNTVHGPDQAAGDIALAEFVAERRLRKVAR